MVALLTGEAFEVIDVGSSPHDHLEGRDDLVAGRAITGCAKQSGRKEGFLVMLDIPPVYLDGTSNLKRNVAK